MKPDVAIIGMACLFPRAPSPTAFWENILAKVDAIGPPLDWPDEFACDPESTDNDRVYTNRGGYLGELARFDPLAYGVMPRTVDGGEPEHFLALRLAHEALADAGYLERPFPRERTAIILGRGTYVNRGMIGALQHGIVIDQTIRLLAALHPEHSAEELAGIKRALKAGLPPFNSETAQSLAHSAMCGRIANRLDLMGPAYTVDAACASSLIAVEQAMKELEHGACDLALAGGIQVSTSFPIAALFCQLGALSRTGRLRPFHPGADGTLLGEGAGILVLKRRADAEEDGDRIYAVIKGVGTASDGKAMGVLAPRVEGEELAMRRAYERAGVAPETIGLLEAHGTGTPAGDATEIEAMRRIFGGRRGPLPACALGSVKSMIGHAIPAAGVAGLMKAALALHHKVLPPTLHAEEGNPKLADSPFYLGTEMRPWIHGGAAPRRAAVSAFGFGGINSHAILEEHAGGQPARPRLQPSELVMVDGRSREELAARCRTLLSTLAGAGGVFGLAEVGLALARDHDPDMPARLAIVASSLDDLRRKLEHAAARLEDPACARIKDRGGIYYVADRLYGPGRLAFLFPGEGAQYPGMLGDLCIHFPTVRAWFDRVDELAHARSRPILPSQMIFPLPGPDAEVTRPLWEMEGGVEAVFAADQALLALLGSLGLEPDAVVGHSSGEYSALLAAGAVRVEAEAELAAHALEMSRVGGRAVDSGLVTRAVLLAVGARSPESVTRVLAAAGDGLHLAMDNCPHQVVLCGSEETIARAETALRAEGAVCQRLPFDRAYHTSLFEPFSGALRTFFDGVQFTVSRVPIYSCMTAAPFPGQAEEMRRLASGQWASRVRFRETVEAMYAAGLRLFVEVGPRGNLTGFVDDILGKRPHVAAASNLPTRDGLGQLHHALALLAAHGAPVALEALFAGRGLRTIAPEVLWRSERRAEPPERSMRLPMALPLLRPDDAVRAAPAQTAEVALPPRPAPGVMATYLRTMNEFLDTQAEVMQAFLRGGLGGARSTPPPPRLALVASAASRAQPDGSLVVHRTVDLSEDLFLLEHPLGGRVASDPSVGALPVFPLAMMLELMAESATLAAPGRRPTHLRDVRAHRWLALGVPRVALELTVRVRDAREIAVSVRRLLDGTRAEPDPPIAEAVVVLEEPAPPPAAGPLALADERPPAWGPRELYDPRMPHGMFHGPALRGVASIDRVGGDGAAATLRALPIGGLLRAEPSPTFALDPLLLDAAGQVLGFWNAQCLDPAVVVFPTAVREVSVHGTLVAPDTARCRLRIVRLEEDRITADIDVVDAQDRLLLRLAGWEVRRFRLPERFFRFRLDPLDWMLSDPLPGIAPEPGIACRRFELPDAFLGEQGAIWLDAMAHLVLTPRERTAWGTMRATDKRRREWLIGRIAAKDAVRALLRERHGLAVYAADVDIVVDERGRPGATGGWVTEVGVAPLVSLAHAGTVAVAAAATGSEGDGIGIDLERLDRASPDIERFVLRPEEQDGITDLEPALRAEWGLRLWCAKEAVGKALGRGLPGGTGDARAGAGRQTGTVEVTLAGALARAFPQHAGTPVLVHTHRDGDAIVAIARVGRDGGPSSRAVDAPRAPALPGP